jgi:hypothetical protein
MGAVPTGIESLSDVRIDENLMQTVGRDARGPLEEPDKKSINARIRGLTLVAEHYFHVQPS